MFCSSPLIYSSTVCQRLKSPSVPPLLRKSSHLLEFSSAGYFTTSENITILYIIWPFLLYIWWETLLDSNLCLVLAAYQGLEEPYFSGLYYSISFNIQSLTVLTMCRHWIKLVYLNWIWTIGLITNCSC